MSNRALELAHGRLLSWSADGTPGAVLQEHEGSIQGALALTDGLLSWSEDGALRSWNTQGEPLAVYSGDAEITHCIVQGKQRFVIGDAVGRMIFLCYRDH